MEQEYKLDRFVRIAVFGVSRSGKDYTIKDFLELANERGYDFIHLSPMDLIRERLGSRHLKDMPDDEKRELVKQVREYIDTIATSNNVIVDEHYCYPSQFHGVTMNDGYYDEKLPHDTLRMPGCRTDYEVVFPRFESMKYDGMVFMDIDPKIIVERMKTSEGVKQNLIATEDDIREWIKVEKYGSFNEGLTHWRWGIVNDPKNSGKQLWDQIHSIIYSMYVDAHPEEW